MSAVAVSLATQAPTAEQLLAELRQAYRAKQSAESQLARLRTYRHHTPGMKADADRYLRQLTAAKDTLQRVLGSAA